MAVYRYSSAERHAIDRLKGHAISLYLSATTDVGIPDFNRLKIVNSAVQIHDGIILIVKFAVRFCVVAVALYDMFKEVDV